METNDTDFCSCEKPKLDEWQKTILRLPLNGDDKFPLPHCDICKKIVKNNFYDNINYHNVRFFPKDVIDSSIKNDDKVDSLGKKILMDYEIDNFLFLNQEKILTFCKKEKSSDYNIAKYLQLTEEKDLALLSETLQRLCATGKLFQFEHDHVKYFGSMTTTTLGASESENKKQFDINSLVKQLRTDDIENYRHIISNLYVLQGFIMGLEVQLNLPTLPGNKRISKALAELNLELQTKLKTHFRI